MLFNRNRPERRGRARAGGRIDARRGAYKIYYENLQMLWRDFYTVETHFTGDLDLAYKHEVVILGSPAAAPAGRGADGALRVGRAAMTLARARVKGARVKGDG